MIRINLLDSTQQKKARRGATPGAATGRAGAALVVFVALAFLTLDGTLAWRMWSQVDRSKRELKAAVAEHAELERKISLQTNEAAEVSRFREVVANQMDVLRSLDPPDRILWSQKINMLASLTPNNVFLDEIRIAEMVEEVETEASKQAIENWRKSTDKNKGPQPAPVRRPVIRYRLVLTGLATGEDHIEQFDNVMAFYRSMIDYQMVDTQGQPQRFMDGFHREMEFEEIKGEVYEGVGVNKFIFRLTTLPMGEEQSNKPEGRQVASAGR